MGEAYNWVVSICLNYYLLSSTWGDLQGHWAWSLLSVFAKLENVRCGECRPSFGGGWTSWGPRCPLSPWEGAHGCLRDGEGRNGLRGPYTSPSAVHGKAWFENMNYLGYSFYGASSAAFTLSLFLKCTKPPQTLDQTSPFLRICLITLF